ncbi:MAG: hypothetical protein ACKVP2_02370 [Burkholderiales bacterium]
MLNWIKGSKSEHPLAEDKTTRELLTELPANDPFKSLEELSHWLDSLIGSEDLKISRNLEVIDLIDQAAKPHLRRLSVEYISGGARLQKFQEIRIWNSVFKLWRKLAEAYQYCIACYHAGTAGAGAVKGQVPMMTARALRALNSQLKWQYLRYGPVATRLWEQFGWAFSFAEEKGFVRSKVTVYPGPFGESSIEREFLKSLMLAMSSTDSLLPTKLEIAERVVAQFSEFFKLELRAAQGCHFYFDLARNRPPARLMSDLAMQPGIRFFGPGTASEELAKVITLVERSGAVPSSINLGGTYEPEMVLEVLRHLALYWSPVPPARISERHNSVSRISVVHDFNEIVDTISGDTEDLSFDSSIETWMVENESEGGYGALLPFAKSDWLKVGTLLGVKLEGGAAWGVGVVRRLSAYDLKQRYVGIQLLSKGGAVVKVSTSDVTGAPGRESAVLLPSNAADSTKSPEMQLLLRPGTYSPLKSLGMIAYERSYVLMPRKLLESGEDFDLVRVKVMQRAQ